MRGLAAARAGRPSSAASPNARIAGRDAVANSPVLSKNRRSCSALFPRSTSTGRCSSAASPRAAIVGVSSSTKRGRRLKLRRMSPARSAEAEAVSRASSTKRPTFRRLSASFVTTVSASATRSRITRSCSARISSSREVWRSAGTARLIVSLRSSGRPARPAPNSFTINRKRSR